MFAAERWAKAFVGALDGAGDDADTGLALLKSLAPSLKSIPGLVSGAAAGARLNRMIHSSLSRAGSSGGADEKVCCFLVLLVQRGRFRYLDQVIRAIEGLLDKRKGIVPVVLDSAFPLEGGYEERLREGLKNQLGVRDVRFEKRVIPELLGGCRLRIGSESLDMTLRTQLQKMTEDLGRLQNTGA